MAEQKQQGLSYKSAGVDIEAGNTLVNHIKPIVAKTRTPSVLAGLGGFGSLFELPLDRYCEPILVSGTDGVGTKLNLAKQLGIHNTIGIDLVAMCVNDIIVLGAEPLFFLDYFATGKLDVDTAVAVVEGIGKGCELAGAALVGGETAEMPGMYTDGNYDLAGFSVGIVEKSKILDGSQVKAGDKLIGLASSGPHSNGYALIRKIVERSEVPLTSMVAERQLGEQLLEPTRIYVKSLLKLMEQVSVHALAHITGGGITENLPRVLASGLQAQINLNAWEILPIFGWLQEQGQVSEAEMLKTFNCGIGMILCVDSNDEAIARQLLEQQGEQTFLLGTVIVSDDPEQTKYT